MLERRPTGTRPALAALLVALLIALPLAAPSPLWADDVGMDDAKMHQIEASPADEPDPEPEPETDDGLNPVVKVAAQTFDLLILRPMTLGWAIFGFALFLPAAIAATDVVDESWDFFVYEPIEATFMTPLGSFLENPEF